MSNVIRFTSVKKPKGDEYKKVTYWNRFVRTKIETIILILLIILGISSLIYRLGNGTMNTLWMIVSLCFIGYPWLIITQFNSSIRYHLRHRDPAEDAPCNYTVMDNGILMENDEVEFREFHRYDEFTSVYTDVFDYFMMFQGSKVLVMIKKADVPAGQLETLEKIVLAGINSECKIKKFI